MPDPSACRIGSPSAKLQETRDYVQRITGPKADQWKGKEVAAKFRVQANAPCQRQAGLFASNGPQSIPLPPRHPGTEPTVQVAAQVAARTGKTHKLAAEKPVTVASADTETLVINIKPKKPQPGAKAKSVTKSVTKSVALPVTVAIAAKSSAKEPTKNPTQRKAKAGKPKSVQVAEARK